MPDTVLDNKAGVGVQDVSAPAQMLESAATIDAQVKLMASGYGAIDAYIKSLIPRIRVHHGDNNQT